MLDFTSALGIEMIIGRLRKFMRRGPRHLRSAFPLSLFAAMAVITQSASAQTDCQIIKPRPTGGAAIGQPGYYCLATDMLVDSRYNPFAHGAEIRGNDSTLLVLGADDIVLDFKRHKVTGNAPLHGGIETPAADKPEYAHLPELEGISKTFQPKNLAIRNGNLRMTRRASYAIGIRIADSEVFFSIASDLVGMWQASTGQRQTAEDVAMAKREDQRLQKKLPDTVDGYPKRNILIEDMTIRTRNVGILVQGANTVIRNSTVEVDAGTAIWIYGPNAVIENNTIIVHGDYSLLDADAPIRLHHGDGAIIRNNRIMIKGHAHKRAISTFDTRAFTVEDNMLHGMTDKDELAKTFRGKLEANTGGNRFYAR
jgi:hypothetical protein